MDTTTDGPAVSAEGIRKRYGDVTAVDGISFDIEPGTIVGVLGPNGAGKAACIKSMLGLIEPTAGDVEICGIDAAERRERHDELLDRFGLADERHY